MCSKAFPCMIRRPLLVPGPGATRLRVHRAGVESNNSYNNNSNSICSRNSNNTSSRNSNNMSNSLLQL